MPETFIDCGTVSLYNQFMRKVKTKGKGGAGMAERRFDDFSFTGSDEYKAYKKAYIEFIKEYKDKITVYSNFDIINNPELTWANQQEMEAEGLHPIPVYHFGTDVKWLQMYLDKGYDYIAIGGMVSVPKATLSAGLDTLWARTLTNAKGYPLAKIHGFGMTAFELMLRYPWYCMTDEHQVLSKRGWIGRAELKVGEEILAFNDGISKWEKVLEIPEFDVKEVPLYEMDYRTFSARVTPNHRWRVLSPHGIWSWQTTESLKSHHMIPRVGDYQAPTEKKYSNEFVQIFAWYWTEGTIKRRNKYKKDSIVIYQSQATNPEKTYLIREALKKEGEKFCESTNKKLEKSFELYGKTRDKLLEISPDKSIPMDFILALTKEQLKIFIEISVLADGSERKLVRKREGFDLFQKNQINIERFQIACLLAGIPTSYQKRNQITASSVDMIYPYQAEKKVVSYSGKLWCVRLPSGAFFTRCNKKIYVTGNSVDSITWTLIGAFGKIIIPYNKNGKWLYNEPPQAISVSNRSPDKKEEGKHISSLAPMERELILSYLSEKGYPLGSSRFEWKMETYKPQKGEKWTDERKGATRLLEVIEKVGLSNDHNLRDEMNIAYFINLAKSAPEWPWPFKVSSQVQEFEF